MLAFDVGMKEFPVAIGVGECLGFVCAHAIVDVGSAVVKANGQLL
jgi:hypothetical protein